MMLNEMCQVLLDRADFRKSCCFYCEINLLGRSLLGEKYGMDVWEDTPRCNGDAAEHLFSSSSFLTARVM